MRTLAVIGLLAVATSASYAGPIPPPELLWDNFLHGYPGDPDKPYDGVDILSSERHTASYFGTWAGDDAFFDQPCQRIGVVCRLATQQPTLGQVSKHLLQMLGIPEKVPHGENVDHTDVLLPAEREHRLLCRLVNHVVANHGWESQDGSTSWTIDGNALVEVYDDDMYWRNGTLNVGGTA